MERTAGRSVHLLLLAGLLMAVLPAGARAQEGPQMDRATGNTTFLDRVPYELGTDLYFQRRQGRQVLDDAVVTGTRDLLFAGTDASLASDLEGPPDGVGLRILDVGDPTAVRVLAEITCLGYHADVGVYENLLLASIDDAETNKGCEDSLDPRGVDREGVAGVRILDVTDPANPEVAGFVDEETLGGGVHNLSVLPDDGLAYIASSDLTPTAPRFAWIDLTTSGFPARVIPMRDISPTASAGCHDIGLDLARDRAFCAAVEQTHIWDISDPRAPTEVSTIVNPAINIHHGARVAPDGRTLVLNDELAGAAAAFGCLGTGSLGLVGALWFYDISDPAAPRPLGSYSTEELSPTDMPCTSHFYNFVPGTSLLSVGWYRSGMVVVDYEDPASPRTEAVFEPANTDFWASYFYRGHFYGSSFRFDAADEGGGGLWVMGVEGVGDVAPAAVDEGTSWSRWTSELPAAQEAGREPAAGTGRPSGTTSPSPLPATGGGALSLALVTLGLAGLLRLPRR